jgi:hypothetical protein
MIAISPSLHPPGIRHSDGDIVAHSCPNAATNRYAHRDANPRDVGQRQRLRDRAG